MRSPAFIEQPMKNSFAVIVCNSFLIAYYRLCITYYNLIIIKSNTPPINKILRKIEDSNLWNAIHVRLFSRQAQ